MRTFAATSVALLFAGALFGQHHGPASNGGSGGRLVSGGQHAAPAAGLGGGALHPVGSGGGSPKPAPVVRYGPVVGPYVRPVYAYPYYYYGYPLYFGAGYVGGYGPGYGSGYVNGSYATDGQGTNVTNVYPPQYDPSMVAQYAPPSPDLSGNPPAGATQTEDQPDHYLVALTDHTIYSVVAYYVEGDTLHYFTAGNVHNQVSLSLVDRALTYRLNKESGLEVKIPEPK